MANQFHIQRPVNGIATADATFAHDVFQPLPNPTGKPPYHLDISNIISAAYCAHLGELKQIQRI